jgi:hypothetical protein
LIGDMLRYLYRSKRHILFYIFRLKITFLYLWQPKISVRTIEICSLITQINRKCLKSTVLEAIVK